MNGSLATIKSMTVVLKREKTWKSDRIHVMEPIYLKLAHETSLVYLPNFLLTVILVLCMQLLPQPNGPPITSWRFLYRKTKLSITLKFEPLLIRKAKELELTQKKKLPTYYCCVWFQDWILCGLVFYCYKRTV